MKENKLGAILLVVCSGSGVIASYLYFFILKPLAGTQEWTGLVLGMAISTVCVIVGIVLLIVISMLKNYLISKTEMIVLAAITKERRQDFFKKESIKNSLKCSKCRRYSIEWNFDRNSFRCLWKDCLWEAKEYEDPEMTKKEEKVADILWKKLNKKG